MGGRGVRGGRASGEGSVATATSGSAGQRTADLGAPQRLKGHSRGGGRGAALGTGKGFLGIRGTPGGFRGPVVRGRGRTWGPGVGHGPVHGLEGEARAEGVEGERRGGAPPQPPPQPPACGALTVPPGHPAGHQGGAGRQGLGRVAGSTRTHRTSGKPSPAQTRHTPHATRHTSHTWPMVPRALEGFRAPSLLATCVPTGLGCSWALTPSPPSCICSRQAAWGTVTLRGHLPPLFPAGGARCCGDSWRPGKVPPARVATFDPMTTPYSMVSSSGPWPPPHSDP